MKANYIVTLTPDDGAYIVRVPDLPGCATTGADVAEALAMAQDAANLWLCDAEDHGEPLPQPSSSILPDAPGQFCAIVHVDTIAYRRQTDTRSVRKNVSIPAWMAAQVDRRGLNCSQILQNALLQQLGND